jgi:hypothetical protein
MASSSFVAISDIEVSGGNIVPGSPASQSSYQGELGGILGSIMFTKYLCNKWNVQSGKVTIGCDCKGAIAVASGKQMVTSRWNSYDLVF